MSKQNEVSYCENLQKEVEELRSRCENFKEEQNSFHDLADKMMEKDKEISRLLDDKKNLHQLLDSRPQLIRSRKPRILVCLLQNNRS
ncbi:protein GRIP-like isoform X1 [Primulina eburnea]|uniref:protein GRIP-like isoform X1 n=1 Tax=Primulina eburnea TaxID=1245227 RepID=UPI003C6C30D4